MIIGDPQQVKAEMEKIAELYQADEITIIPNVSGIHNRMKGIELLAEAFGLEQSHEAYHDYRIGCFSKSSVVMKLP